MTRRPSVFRSLAPAFVLLLLFLGSLAAPSPARAVVSILPGGSADLGGTDVGGGADGAQKSCSIGSAGVSCLLGFLGTTADGSANLVSASHRSYIGTGLGEPHTATARLYDDFFIPGSPDSLVAVQISVDYDFYASFLGSAAYECAGDVSLVVDDVTTAPAEGVGSTTFFHQDRSGDQGFTDITTGREVYRASHARGQLSLLLRRGRTYRVWFEVSGMGEQFVVGQNDVDVDATRRRMVVRVDEDEVDLLAVHDEDIKDRIATHDHDIKEQLDRIEDKIDDINEKLSLVLKTQIQQALVAPQESRLTVLHTDRLEEVCDTAQEAIDASEGLGYRVKQIAQSLVDRARSVMAADPKAAVAMCRNAYQSAAFPRKLE